MIHDRLISELRTYYDQHHVKTFLFHNDAKQICRSAVRLNRTADQGHKGSIVPNLSKSDIYILSLWSYSMTVHPGSYEPRVFGFPVRLV